MNESVAGTLVPMYGEFRAVVTRGNGAVEDYGWRRNQLTSTGLNRIASRAVMATSPFFVLGVGTVTNAASLGSTEFGEVSRKQGIENPSSSGLYAVQSREWIAVVATWGGAADSVTSVALDSAAILCHASSGQGIVANIVNGLAVTLANSDFLHLTARIRVGSHDVGHTG